MQSPMQMNRKAKAEITRQVILDAAEEVFFDHGLSGATLEAIAQRSGVTRGAIYWHFANKIEVFEAIFERTVSYYETLMAEITQKAASLDEFEAFLVRSLREIAGDPNKQRPLSILLLRHERLPHEDKILASSRESSERICDMIAAFIKRVQPPSMKFNVISPRRRAEALQFYMQGMLMHFLQYPETTNLAAHAKAYMRLFFDNLKTT